MLAEGIRPLSAVKDMIGSQATKAMHLLALFAPHRIGTGVWSDRTNLTVIETYPSLCRHRLGQIDGEVVAMKSGKEADIRDAAICAMIARDFHCHNDRLEPPCPEAPPCEGWIWAPMPVHDRRDRA